MFSLFGNLLMQELVERILAILSDEQGMLSTHVYLFMPKCEQRLNFIAGAPSSDKHFSPVLTVLLTAARLWSKKDAVAREKVAKLVNDTYR